MNEKDITSVISHLSKKRPVFHSEADFQFSLACEIIKRFPDADVRLERPFGDELNKYLDILVQIGSDIYPIELKYMTQKLNPMVVEADGEKFQLKQHGATDLVAYNCLKDIERIEELSKHRGFKTGFVVWITNDTSYLREPKNLTANYIPFSIHEGAIKTGEMRWDAGTMAGNIINLKGQYHIKWNSYSNLGKDIKNGEFRYVLLAVDLLDDE